MSSDEAERLNELKRELQDISSRFQDLALRFEAEISRQRIVGEASHDALADMRDAIDKLGDDLQKWVDKLYRVERDLHRQDGRIEGLVVEFAEWRDLVRKELQRVHDRISGVAKAAGERIDAVRREAKDDTKSTEARILQLARDWGPLIVTGLLATLVGTRLV